MNSKLLLLDNNTDKFDEYYPAWRKLKVSPIQIQTMREAIERLSHEEFAMIIINADSINYLPQLSIMRDVTGTPIHIYASKYSINDEVEAVTLGANQYRKWPDDILKLIMLESIRIKRYDEMMFNTPLNLVIHKNISPQKA